MEHRSPSSRHRANLPHEGPTAAQHRGSTTPFADASSALPPPRLGAYGLPTSPSGPVERSSLRRSRTATRTESAAAAAAAPPSLPSYDYVIVG